MNKFRYFILFVFLILNIGFIVLPIVLNRVFDTTLWFLLPFFIMSAVSGYGFQYFRYPVEKQQHKKLKPKGRKISEIDPYGEEDWET